MAIFAVYADTPCYDVAQRMLLSFARRSIDDAFTRRPPSVLPSMPARRHLMPRDIACLMLMRRCVLIADMLHFTLFDAAACHAVADSDMLYRHAAALMLLRHACRLDTRIRFRR